MLTEYRNCVWKLACQFLSYCKFSSDSDLDDHTKSLITHTCLSRRLRLQDVRKFRYFSCNRIKPKEHCDSRSADDAGRFVADTKLIISAGRQTAPRTVASSSASASVAAAADITSSRALLTAYITAPLISRQSARWHRPVLSRLGTAERTWLLPQIAWNSTVSTLSLDLHLLLSGTAFNVHQTHTRSCYTPMISSGVARICCEEGQSWKLGYGALTADFRAGAAAAWWLIVLWLMQYWSKELWVVDICTSWSRRLHNTWIDGSQIYSKVN